MEDIQMHIFCYMSHLRMTIKVYIHVPKLLPVSAAPAIVLLLFYQLWTTTAPGLNPQARTVQPGVEIRESAHSLGAGPSAGYHLLASPAAAQTCCTNTV